MTDGAAESGSCVELRIHGVGGASPERLLGERHPDDVVELDRGHRTGLWARRHDYSVQGYVWGGLTSGAKLQPLWIVLLPFTLANAAGWMHLPVTADPGRRRQVRDIRRLVTLLGYTLTITWALWLAVVVGDLLVYQGGGNVPPIAETPFYWALALGAFIALAGLLWKWWKPLLLLGLSVMAAAAGAFWLGNRYVRAAGGVVVAEVLLGVLVFIGGISRRQYEQHQPRHLRDISARSVSGDEDMRSPTFFARPEASRRLLMGHAVAVAVVTALLVVRALARSADGQESLGFGFALVLLNTLQLVLVAVLAVRSLGEWQRFQRRWRVAGPAAAMGLAILLTNAVFSGLTLFVANRVQGGVTGAELALVDIFVEVALLALAVLLLGWLPYFLAARPPPPPPDASPQELAWRKPRFTRSRLARAFRHIDVICSSIVGFLVVASLAAVAIRTDAHGSAAPWNWSIDPNGGLGPLRSAAVWLLPFAIPAIGGVIRVAARSATKRRNIGNVWDVLGLWPRHYHPLAVRPYAERAIPELQDHVRRVVTTGRPLLVSAHSQGSVLAFAALSGLSGERRSDGSELLERVALVTYGSPLGRLHSRFFPGYVGPAELGWLRSQLFAWRNFFRPTDHIGQRVFEDLPAAEGDDVQLPDPAEGPMPPEGPSASPTGSQLEADRTPWRDLAGHNDYPREPALKRWVEDMKQRLGGNGGRSLGSAKDMSTPDEPPPIARDLAKDEPDLPSDVELEAMTPPLPPMDDMPLSPVPPVPPGPAEPASIAGEPAPDVTLQNIAETVEEGDFPEERP